MKFRDLAASSVAVVMSVAPAFAKDGVHRASTQGDAFGQMKGSSTLLLVLAILLIGLGIAIAAGNKSDKPSSP